MVPVVRAVDRPGRHRPVRLHLAARVGHPRRYSAGIWSEPTASSSTCTLTPARQRSARARRGGRGGLALLEDVLGVGDGPPGGADGRELGREDLLPVQQDVHAIARHHRRAGVRHQGGLERGLTHRERGELEVGLDVIAGRAQDQQGDRGEQSARESPEAARAHSLRRTSIRSSVAGCVLRKPPPPPFDPDEAISQVSVSIMSSFGRPIRLRRSTPWRSAAYSSLRL